MWIWISIALLVVLLLFFKLKGKNKDMNHSGIPKPIAEVSEETTIPKVDTPITEKEILEDRAMIGVKLSSSQHEIEAIKTNPSNSEKENPEQNTAIEVEFEKPQQPIKKDAANVKNKIQEIEAKIKIEIERRQAIPVSFPFLAVCSVLDLDPDSEDLAHEFIAEVYTRLRLQGQLIGHGPHKVPEHPPVRNMLESVMESAYEMLLYADDNAEVIRSYKPMLLSKQRSLTTRDQYGDEDLKPWFTFSSRFAVDKLKGVGSLKTFMEFFASDSHRSTVSAQGLADMFGHFTRVALIFIKSGPDDQDEAPITGVEYERMLQQEIEENFPEAHVSMTSATGDHGTDLIVDIKGIRIAIQAKYYQSAVGNAAVQEAFSGKGFYEADFAMVVCNSTFTRHAKELSEKINVILATTDNYIQLIRMLTEEDTANSAKE